MNSEIFWVIMCFCYVIIIKDTGMILFTPTAISLRELWTISSFAQTLLTLLYLLMPRGIRGIFCFTGKIDKFIVMFYFIIIYCFFHFVRDFHSRIHLKDFYTRTLPVITGHICLPDIGNGGTASKAAYVILKLKPAETFHFFLYRQKNIYIKLKAISIFLRPSKHSTSRFKVRNTS